MPDIYSVGVDLGGTWIRLEAVDLHGRSVRSFKAPGMPLSELPGFLKKRLATWKSSPPHLVVGSRGVWTRPEKAHLKKALRSLAKHVTVMSDVEAAWHASFSHGAGIVVIAGTGSIAYGRNAKGQTQRAGGWGPLLGDEGSAFWIGKTWLKKTRGHEAGSDILKLARKPHQAVRRIAAMAPRILGLARRGNRLARYIVQDAQQALAEQVWKVAEDLRIQADILVSWGGSLLGNPQFRSGFRSALQRRRGHRFHLIHPGDSPAQAIARLFTHGH